MVRLLIKDRVCEQEVTLYAQEDPDDEIALVSKALDEATAAGADVCEASVSDTSGNLLGMSTILVEHAAHMCKHKTLRRWINRLCVLYCAARAGTPGYLVARASARTGRFIAFALAINEEERDILVDEVPIAGNGTEDQSVPIAMPILWPSGPDAVHSNWVLSSRFVVFGRLGLPMFAFGPYPNAEMAKRAQARHTEEVRRMWGELIVANSMFDEQEEQGPQPWITTTVRPPAADDIQPQIVQAVTPMRELILPRG